jgi:ATPase subunit of ABC transporter with duplicated ATPase domains
MSADPGSPSEVAATAAMDRVLQAERHALAALAECERLSAAELEQARQRRRTILEHTQARIVALHARAAQALERRAAEILERHLRSATAEVEQLADPERRRAALERLAARLTTAEGEAGVGR